MKFGVQHHANWKQFLLYRANTTFQNAPAQIALKNQLSDRALAIFETGARYQMYHALALLLVALLLSYAQESQTFFAVAGWAFIAGTIIFSGSLYALSLTDIKWLGAITPLGGVAFIVGWGCLAVAAFNFK